MEGTKDEVRDIKTAMTFGFSGNQQSSFESPLCLKLRLQGGVYDF